MSARLAGRLAFLACLLLSTHAWAAPNLRVEVAPGSGDPDEWTRLVRLETADLPAVGDVRVAVAYDEGAGLVVEAHAFGRESRRTLSLEDVRELDRPRVGALVVGAMLRDMLETHRKEPPASVDVPVRSPEAAEQRSVAAPDTSPSTVQRSEAAPSAQEPEAPPSVRKAPPKVQKAPPPKPEELKPEPEGSPAAEAEALSVLDAELPPFMRASAPDAGVSRLAVYGGVGARVLWLSALPLGSAEAGVTARLGTIRWVRLSAGPSFLFTRRSHGSGTMWMNAIGGRLGLDARVFAKPRAQLFLGPSLDAHVLLVRAVPKDASGTRYHSVASGSAGVRVSTELTLKPGAVLFLSLTAAGVLRSVTLRAGTDSVLSYRGAVAHADVGFAWSL